MYRPTRSRLRTLSLTLTLGALVALYGAGAAHAQNNTGTGTTPPEPEPCAANPADEVSSSLVDGSQEHLALFDVYWDYADNPLDPNSKTLITNPCPPLVVHHPAQYDDRGDLITPAHTTRGPSDVDIGHTIIHIPSSELQKPAEGDIQAVRSFKRTVTADGTGDYDGDRYNFLRERWVKNDDEELEKRVLDSANVWVVPACEEGETPTRNDNLDPPFCLGFSAGLLTPGDWAPDPANPAEGTKVQYEFEAIREPGHAIPQEGERSWGDFFVFHVENGRPEVIWRTDDADTNVYDITPGTYDHAFWAFTAPGTYVFHVHAKGHPSSAPSVGFDPIPTATTVSSEVRRYTFHVGDLTVNQNPMFEVTRSVPENSVQGINVGAPICVKDIDDDTLCFNLHGDGAADNFTIDGSTDANKCGTLTAVNRSTATEQICAQIQVKEGASLDYETTASYDLTLQVSDRKDPESNEDPAPNIHIDASIAVTIDVEDENPETTITLTPSSSSPIVGADITLSWNSPQGASFTLYTHPVGSDILIEDSPVYSGELATSPSPGQVQYRVRARYDNAKKEVYSDWVTVNWTAGSGPGA